MVGEIESDFHTSEPWRVMDAREKHHFARNWRTVWSGRTPVIVPDAFQMTSEGRHGHCDPVDYHGVRISAADARRLIACVNYCKGISTDELEASAKQRGIV